MAGMEQVRALLANFGPIAGADIADLRTRYDVAGASMPGPDGWSEESTQLGQRPALRQFGPEARSHHAILYLHGGGYTTGSARSHATLAAHLGKATQAQAYALDYRLAPEHPFPAAVTDAVDAWRALMELGFEPQRCAIIGDSAGGGLAVATAVAARDVGLPQPAALVALSPWANLAQEGFSYEECAARDPIVSKIGLDANARAYLAGTDAKTPLASPIFADLAGLAPLLIHVGTDEVLLADAEALKTAAREAGVDATLEVWSDVVHVWHFLHPLLDEAREAIDEVGGWLRRRMPA